MHFGNDPRPGDKQPIMAEKDEYVVNRNAARKHKHLLDYLNFIDEPRFDNRDMAHSAIDEAMALNTLSQVGMQEGGNIPQELTYGQKFVKRFPSKHKDPERAAGQERGLASVIDFFIPQSPLDVLMSVAPVGAFGKVGKKAMKKILERAKKVPGKKSPFREGRANVDMQYYTDYSNWASSPQARDEMLEEVLSPKRRPLSTIYDEEGEMLDLVDVLKSQGLQQGGEVESKTLKDMVDPYLPKKDDMLPFLEFLTGATAETDEYQPGAVDAAMAIPVLGGIGRLGKKGYATLSRLLRRYGKEGRELDRVFGKGSAKKALEPGSDLTTDTKYYREVGIDSPRKEPISWDEMEEIRKTAGDEYGFGSKFDIFGAEGKYPPGFTRDKFGAIFGKTVDDVTGETFEKFRLSPSGKHLPTDAKFQQGGLIDDKSKRKGGYSLGVKDELAESVDYFQDLDKILSAVRHQDRYDFGKSERSTIDFLGESGIMDIEEALKHLDHIQKRYHEGTVGFHMPRYQSGGTITYGDQSSNIPTLDEIYSMAGVKPNAEQRSQFESNFTYDPTREGTTISSYMGNLAGNRQSGSAGLGTATTKAQELGGGFAGFGERKAMTQEARAGAENIYGAAVESSKRGMFEDIRGDREAYIQAALSELTRLEGIGGTNPYSVNTSGMSEGEQQYHHQAEWYQLGFPDVDSYDAWIASGGDSSTMGSYGQDPSAALGNLGATVGLSDRRLKKDVNYLFTMENNVPIYTFKYNWSDDIEIGTMAQDIEDIIPEAVSELNGYKLVDYKQIFK